MYRKQRLSIKTFEREKNSLLSIECRHAIKDYDVEEIFFKLLNIAKRNPSKKIILIIQQENYVTFMEHIKIYFQQEKLSVLENDPLDLKDFEPEDDPLLKDVLVFQEQKEKVSLSNVTGINSWNSYVDKISQETRERGLIDGKTLVKILNNDQIEVGSKAPITNNLENAYVKIFEEINVATLAKKLMSQQHDTNTNDIYIISVVCGSTNEEKTDRMFQYLGLSRKKEINQDKLGYISSDDKIQLIDDQFHDKDFQRLCFNYPEKRIFWICVKWENNVTKFLLQEIFNPEFY